MPRLELLGLGVRAGSVVVGTSGVRSTLQREQAKLVIVPEDASPRTQDKVVRLATARGVPVLQAPSARELGRLVGQEEVQAVAVRDANLASGICTDDGDRTEEG